MSKVISTSQKTKSSMRIELAKYTTSDIVTGVVIGIQCVLALGIIIYHFF